jgi:hypothetical protein
MEEKQRLDAIMGTENQPGICSMGEEEVKPTKVKITVEFLEENIVFEQTGKLIKFDNIYKGILLQLPSKPPTSKPTGIANTKIELEGSDLLWSEKKNS